MTCLDCLTRAILTVSETILVRRYSQGAYDEKGRWLDAGVETFSILASVQPAKPEDLKHIDEGRRTSEALKVFSIEELLTASVDRQTQPDVVLWGGREYQVEEVTKWDKHGGYWKALALRKGQ